MSGSRRESMNYEQFQFVYVVIFYFVSVLFTSSFEMADGGWLVVGGW